MSRKNLSFTISEKAAHYIDFLRKTRATNSSRFVSDLIERAALADSEYPSPTSPAFVCDQWGADEAMDYLGVDD